LNSFIWRTTRQTPRAWLAQIGVALLASLLLGALAVLQDRLPQRVGYLLVMAAAGGCALMIIGNLKKVLLAAILIDIPLRWDVYLGARVANSPLGMREGWMIGLTTLALVGLLAIYLLQELARPHSHPRLRLADNLPLLAYMGVVCLSTFVAQDTRGALFQIFFLAQMVLLYVYVVSVTRTAGDVWFIMLFLLAGLALEGLIVLAQRFLGLQINLLGIVTVNSYGRMAGTLGSPNVAAGFFSLLLAPALGLAFGRISNLARAGALAAFGLGGLGLLLTISRGGWMAFAISVIFVVLMLWLRGRLSSGVVVVALFAAVVGLVLFGGVLFDRLVGMRTNAAMARIPLMKLAWEMIRDRPFLGVGANNYVLNMKQYMIPELTRGFLYVVHNKYLLVWAETGLMGILTYLGFLGLTLWRGWRCWTRNHPLFSPLALGLIAAIVGQMAHMMVEIFDARSQVQSLWLVAALVSALDAMTRSGNGEEAAAGAAAGATGAGGVGGTAGAAGAAAGGAGAGGGSHGSA